MTKPSQSLIRQTIAQKVIQNEEMLIPYLVCKTGMVVFEHTGLGNMGFRPGRFHVVAVLGFPDSGAQGSGCIGLDVRVLGWGSWIRENKQLPPGLQQIRIRFFVLLTSRLKIA